MLSAAILGVLFVPVFYVVIRRLMRDPLDGPQRTRTEAAPAPMPAGNE
jgi:hypothetical protein